MTPARLTDSALINHHIRTNAYRERLWDALTTSQKRDVIAQADGSALFLDNIFEDVAEGVFSTDAAAETAKETV